MRLAAALLHSILPIAASAQLALGIALMASSPPLVSFRSCLALILLLCPYPAKRRIDWSSWFDLGVLFLIGCGLLAIPGSMLWGYGLTGATAWTAIFVTGSLSVYFLEDKQIVRYVFWCFLGYGLLNAALLFMQGFRGTGLTGSQPMAAEVLILSGVWLAAASAGKSAANSLLTIALFLAALMAGARWEAICLGLLIPLLVWRKLVQPWQVLLLCGIAGMVIVGEHWRLSWDTIWLDLKWRLYTDGLPRWLPSGYADFSGIDHGPHTTVVKVAYESGILAGVVFALIVGVLLFSKPRFTSAWFVLLALGLFGLLEYLPWLPLGGLFALALAYRAYETDG